MNVADIDLGSLSQEELTKLRKDVDRAIKSYDARKKKEAIAALESKAKELGFSLAELTGDQKTGKTKGPPKYAHPENAAVTWTGRGRQPVWIKEGLASGKTLEDFLIA